MKEGWKEAARACKRRDAENSQKYCKQQNSLTLQLIQTVCGTNFPQECLIGQNYTLTISAILKLNLRCMCQSISKIQLQNPASVLYDLARQQWKHWLNKTALRADLWSTCLEFKFTRLEHPRVRLFFTHFKLLRYNHNHPREAKWTPTRHFSK